MPGVVRHAILTSQVGRRNELQLGGSAAATDTLINFAAVTPSAAVIAANAAVAPAPSLAAADNDAIEGIAWRGALISTTPAPNM